MFLGVKGEVDAMKAEGGACFAERGLQNIGVKSLKILHYPQLDTVLMVEEFIREHSGEFRKRQLWEHLPKKMMYQTFCVTINYLETSGKIAVDREGKVAWIWDPEGVRRYLKKRHLAWR